MHDRTAGIIVRTRPLTETSLIVHWLTRECGRIATVAKGARRPKSVFRGKLDLFYEADLSFSRSRNSDLHTLREVIVRNLHPALRCEVAWLRQATYAAALVEQTTETDTAIPAIFTLYQEFLARLAATPAKATMPLAFELKLLRELGLDPDLEASSLSPGSRKIAQHLTQTDWMHLNQLIPSFGQLREIQQFLHGFLIFHLGRIPKGRAAAIRGDLQISD